MDTFNFVCQVADSYPQSSTPVKFGSGYEFASRPRAPDQITFRLYFSAMVWYFSAGVAEATTHPTYNMLTLINFYEAHRLYEPFLFTHPRLGSVTVRFAAPLETPRIIPIGTGRVTESFEMKLILQP